MTNRSTSGRERSIYVWLGLIVVAAFYAFYALQYDRSIAFGDDPSVYLTSAKSIIAGRGYRLINFPDAPIANFYPIGYPAVLALALSVFPKVDPVAVSGAASTGMSFAWIVGAAFFLRRYMRTTYASLAAIALGLTQRVFLTTWSIASEWPFALLVMAAVVVGEQSAGNPGRSEVAPNLEHATSRPRGGQLRAELLAGTLVGLLIGAAMLMRSMGVTIVAGVGAYFLFTRRPRALAGYVVGIAATEGPWILWNRANHAGGGLAGYIAQYKHEATILTPVHNFATIVSMSAPATLFPFLDTRAWHHLSHVGLFVQSFIGLLIVGLAVIGLVSLLRSGNIIAYCCIPYLVLVLIWPWDPERFCIPILPLLIVVCAQGCRALLAFLKARKWDPTGKWRTMAGRVVVASLAISILSSVAQDTLWMRHLVKTGSIGGDIEAQEWRSRLEAFHYLKQQTPENSVIISSYPFGTYLFTDRHTLQQLSAKDLSDTIDRWQGSGPVYVFATYRTSVAEVDEGNEFGLTPVNDYITAHPGVLTLLWSDSTKDTFIYSVSKPAFAGAGNTVHSAP